MARKVVRKGLEVGGPGEVWQRTPGLAGAGSTAKRVRQQHQGQRLAEASGSNLTGSAGKTSELPALQVVKHGKSIGIACFCVKNTGFACCGTRVRERRRLTGCELLSLR